MHSRAALISSGIAEAPAFYLTPGLDIAGFGYSGNLQGFHIDGLKDSNIGYFQDGTFAVGNNNGTIYTTDPIQSTVEEVKVLSSTLPAEYGHSAGGAMTAVQRTGTKTLHGEVSEFGRVSAMQHRKYFDLYHFGQIQPGQVATPSELFQQPNATLHGPVYIPKLYNGKNRTRFCVRRGASPSKSRLSSRRIRFQTPTCSPGTFPSRAKGWPPISSTIR